MKTLGDVIKSYREENRLSLREFANLCGVSHSYVDKLEKGVDPRNGKPVEPTLDIIKKIALSLNISLDELLKEIGEIQHPTLLAEKSFDQSLGLSNNLTKKDEKDIEKRMQKMREDLTNSEGLMYSGEPMSPEAIESVLSALEFGMKQAKLINKKYTPKRYRKENNNK